MSDLPESIWADPPDIFDDMSIWYNYPTEGQTKYVRADTVQAQIDDAIWAIALVVDEKMEQIGFCYGPDEFGRRAEMRNVIGEQLSSEAARRRAVTVQAQIDEARLRKTLHDLITEQSEGEWDDKTINTDVEVFLTAILALIRKGNQP